MYVPHTEDDTRSMLDRLGIKHVDELFDCIPKALRFAGELNIPPQLTEIELAGHMGELAAKNLAGGAQPSFLGAGCYDHFVPAVVDVIGSRPEYYTAYTPYQSEASQGTLQVSFEFQTLMCQLTGLDVSNSSLYDGATAMVEAALMALAALPQRRTILVSETVHPEYRQTLASYLTNLQGEQVVVPAASGLSDMSGIASRLDETVACVITQSPNIFGRIEDLSAIAAKARSLGIVPIQVFDPISLGLLRNPGSMGMEIAVAEGQGMGTPPSYGGPFLGILACRESYVRRIPGRVVGQTVDRRGQRAFVLTLQTREQHIRREKATSNICTNQGLLALRASVYLALVGPQGLRETAELCTQKAHYAAGELSKIGGITLPFDGPFFKEFVIKLPGKAEKYVGRMLELGYRAGVPLGPWYPNLEDCALVAVTEKRTRSEIDGLATAWRKALA